MDEGQKAAVTAFFDDFVTVFASFDGARVAAKFSVPCLARGSSSRVFGTEKELAEYFQTHLDHFYAQGCRSCRYAHLDMHWLGSECVVASVRWTLTDAEGADIASWSESYLLTFAGGRALAFATVDHAGA